MSAKTGEVYVATIQVVIDADSPADARGALAVFFNENVGCANGPVMDWEYAKIGGQFLTPTLRRCDLPYLPGGVLGVMQ